MERKHLITFFATIMIFASCKVEHLEYQPDLSANEAKIKDLKLYLSKVANIDVAYIEYNEKTQSFAFAGVEQISLEKLTDYYQQSKIDFNNEAL